MLLIAAVLGYAIGVFLNLCADFLPATPRLSPFRLPRCAACGAELRSLSLAGGVADLFGWSRCTQCGAGRRVRAPLVEVGTAAVFVFLAYQYGLDVRFTFMAVYFSVLILVLVTDLEHRLIPDVVMLPAMAIALGGSFLVSNMTPVRALIGGALGFGLFYVLALLARGGLGGGDVMLMGFLGLATGFPAVLLVVLVGILLGGLGAIVLLLARRVGLKSYIAYGPYLVIAGAVTLLYGRAFLLWYFSAYTQ